MLRHHRYGGLARLDQRWSKWEQWVIDIGQTHMTHPVLPFSRSPDPEHSWITAVGALLDAANLRLSTAPSKRPGGESAVLFSVVAARQRLHTEQSAFTAAADRLNSTDMSSFIRRC